jgi:hypothetical protein
VSWMSFSPRWVGWQSNKGRVDVVKKQHDRNAQLVPETYLQCPEPGCNGTLKRKWSPANRQWFYGCDRWASKGCHGAVGCHPDGSPLGRPADQTTRRARREAHEAFDELWEEGWMSRSAAYDWLAREMDLSEAHMAKMDKRQCAQVVERCRAKLEELEEAQKEFDEEDDFE